MEVSKDETKPKFQKAATCSKNVTKKLRVTDTLEVSKDKIKKIIIIGNYLKNKLSL